ncbi:MAG TPA: hypothetical protein VHS59_13290 [Bacillota bacterium]|nr:hypothetical protein [Bacillota bacterium]
MALKQIWSDSCLGRCSAAFALVVDKSGLVNWYKGSEKYHNVTLLKSSWLYKLLVWKGKLLAWLVNGLGRVLRPLVKPSGAMGVITGINASLLEQPIRLASLFGLGLVAANTVVKLVANPNPSLRSLLLRGGLLAILLVGTTVKTGWRQLTSSSVAAKAVQNIIWGD